MNFKEYQREAVKTAKTWDNKDFAVAYCGLGLAGETGEVVDMLKKHFSGSKRLEGVTIDELKLELGDVMWYVAALCENLGFDMGEIAEMNIDKLRKRHGTSWSGYGKR